MKTAAPIACIGRAPFLSAESAAIDDFSRMPIQALRDAVNYGANQLILTRRGKTVLRELRAELQARP